jgi:hypothetical protein
MEGEGKKAKKKEITKDGMRQYSVMQSTWVFLKG